MVNGVGDLRGPLGQGLDMRCLQVDKGGKQRASVTVEGQGRDRLPSSGGGEGKEQEGTGSGSGLCSVKFQASETIRLLVLQSMDINKGD